MPNSACHDPLHAIETASVDVLRNLQLQRMKKTLRHAYGNSLMYRDKFDASGVHPDELVSLEDLVKSLIDISPFRVQPGQPPMSVGLSRLSSDGLLESEFAVGNTPFT